ncbi:MAG: Formamidopyrimidine-DNA glycosylase [Myxococcales bacterium]|nr:Formamidopyrimidine-DNA glycosylase [Myxococcales bacterium]
MPELPEVEVARRNLEKWLRGAKLTHVELSPRIYYGGSAPLYARRLTGRRISAVERRGKWLRLVTDGEPTLYSHLGMTGKWVLRKHDDPPQRFERARLDSARRSVRYLDPRLFGRIYGISGNATPPPAFTALGPDALTDGIDPAVLHARLSRIKRSVKEALLDQTILAGVGNIQAAEGLWRARIHPERAASSLSPAEVRALARGLEGSIRDTLAREDSPEITYVEEAGADNPFDVYGKEGQPCPRCKTTLRRIVQGGRSTVYCPRCQPRVPARRAR